MKIEKIIKINNLEITQTQFLVLRTTLIDKLSTGIDGEHKLLIQNLINLFDEYFLKGEI